jgi:hypothetical protein
VEPKPSLKEIKPSFKFLPVLSLELPKLIIFEWDRRSLAMN